MRIHVFETWMRQHELSFATFSDTNDPCDEDYIQTLVLYARQIFTLLPSVARRPSQILVEVVHTTDTHPSQFTEQRWRNAKWTMTGCLLQEYSRIQDSRQPHTPDPLLVLALLLKVVEKRMGLFVRVKSGPQDVLFKYIP